jgi:hypothetical protein
MMKERTRGVYARAPSHVKQHATSSGPNKALQDTISEIVNTNKSLLQYLQQLKRQNQLCSMSMN